MKTFQMESRPNHLMLQNVERIDEAVVFNQVAQKLRGAPGVALGEVQESPYADIMAGKLHTAPFTLLLDLDYGTELYCEDGEARQKLKELIEAD